MNSNLLPGGGTIYYDPQGRLVLLQNSSTNPTFDYDGVNLATIGTWGVSAIDRRYVYGPGTDEPLVWYEGSGTTDRRWLYQDERGSVIGPSRKRMSLSHRSRAR